MYASTIATNSHHTFGLTVGNLWDKLSSLNCTAALSGLRLLLNASQMDLCIGFIMSNPVKPINARGFAVNSAGKLNMM